MGDYSNFTTPDQPTNGPSPGTPGGTGDHGEKWDPVSGRWIPLGQPGNMPVAPAGAGGFSTYAAGNNVTGGQQGATDTGRVGNDLSWGGYSSTVGQDANGNLVNDPSQNGASADINRYRSMAAAAAARQAYQIDYSAADRFAGSGLEDRGYQVDAMNLAKQTAEGRNLQSMKLGQSMLQQSVQAQQAGAQGARGGSLAQAAAMRQQAAGQGAFMQQGNTQLQAQRAAEMAQGRDAYMGQATGLRASDAQAQGLNQQQGIAQMGQELGQRGLNQAGQMGYEEMGQKTGEAAQNAGMRSKEIDQGIAATNSQNDQNDKNRSNMYGRAGMSAVGTLLTAGVKGSDVRMKQDIKPLGLAATVMARRGY